MAQEWWPQKMHPVPAEVPEHWDTSTFSLKRRQEKRVLKKIEEVDGGSVRGPHVKSVLGDVIVSWHVPMEVRQRWQDLMVSYLDKGIHWSPSD
ncbi:hypothetical protein JHK82_031714 [Glycine max]|nr:hypothetical protein JHK85_032375 [Glycine max]KAG4994981.1 hypothetical protein JHK86_031808 [Glycine max]KAG5124977.1 hypothetical protein JHK82_031714 [Glycine max]KAG5146407.1 hypothetical protein JHK84_031950 [Glycine max]